MAFAHRLWFDTETYSECDLRAAGGYRYFEHPSTEVTVVQWALDDGRVVVEDLSDGEPPSLELVRLLHDPSVEIVAHNSQFDRTAVRVCLGLDVPVERWHDTMIRALSHALPGSLGEAGKLMGLPQDKQKDSRGHDLIMLFCKPQPRTHERNTKHTHPKEWAEFLEYAAQDIVALRELEAVLPRWNYRDDELALWHLDQRINDRGFKVDTVLAEAALRAIGETQSRLKREMADASQGLAPTQTKALVECLRFECGIDIGDLRAATARTLLLSDIPAGVRRIIELRLESAKASVAKYRALLRSVGEGDRLRGTLQYSGAKRTRRWSGRIFQPQNMARPKLSVSEIADGIGALKAGLAVDLHEHVLALCADTLRPCIIAEEGRKIVTSDLSNIEGRYACWTSRELWKIQAFRDFDAGTGPDVYKASYGRSFGLPPDEVSGGQRQIGKVLELSMQYGGGEGAFVTFAGAYNIDLAALAASVLAAASEDEVETAEFAYRWAKGRKQLSGLEKETWKGLNILKRAWRAAHLETVATWRALEDAFREAVNDPGFTYKVNDLAFRCEGEWLRIRLQSGKYLCYLAPRAEVVEDPEVDEDGNQVFDANGKPIVRLRFQLSYLGEESGSHHWGRQRTYGGKLFENICQSGSRDVMGTQMPLVEAYGYSIILTVHDEIVTEPLDTDEFTEAQLSDLMSAPVPWAPDLPLAAKGFEGYAYFKN